MKKALVFILFMVSQWGFAQIRTYDFYKIEVYDAPENSGQLLNPRTKAVTGKVSFNKGMKHLVISYDTLRLRFLRCSEISLQHDASPAIRTWRVQREGQKSGQIVLATDMHYLSYIDGNICYVFYLDKNSMVQSNGVLYDPEKLGKSNYTPIGGGVGLKHSTD